MYKINNHCIGNTLHIAKDFRWQGRLGAVTKFTFSSGRTSQWFTRKCCQKWGRLICNLTATVFLKNFICINIQVEFTKLKKKIVKSKVHVYSQRYLYLCWIYFHFLFSDVPRHTHTHTHTHVVCLVARLCPTRCDPMECSPSGSSFHGISQVRILEWVAISFSKIIEIKMSCTLIRCINIF